MSPAALKILSAAYESYLKTNNRHYAYQVFGAEDWIDALAGVRQLHQDNLIESDLYYVADQSITIAPDTTAPFTFCITEMGIEEISSHRNPKVHN